MTSTTLAAFITTVMNETRRAPRFQPRIGLGCWRLAGPDRPSRSDALATIAAAYEAGARVFDTADCYSLDEDEHGYGELLVRDALAGADDVTVVTKGGWARPGGEWENRGDPKWLARAIEESATRLGVEQIDCYLLHAIDPAFDMLDSLEPLVEAYASGRVATIGISNVTPAEVERAYAAAPISVVQNRLSVTVREPGWREVLDACIEHDLWWMPHTPFGPTPEEGGMVNRVVDDPVVQRIAGEVGLSPAATSLSWLLTLAPRTVLVPGARRIESILDSLTGSEDALSAEQIAELTALRD